MLDHITHDELTASLASLYRLGPLSPGTGRAIAERVARKHRLTFNDIWQEDRTPHLVRARCEAWHFMKKELGLSNKLIGKIFNDRDPSTITHGLNRWETKWKHMP